MVQYRTEKWVFQGITLKNHYLVPVCFVLFSHVQNKSAFSGYICVHRLYLHHQLAPLHLCMQCQILNKPMWSTKDRRRRRKKNTYTYLFYLLSAPREQFTGLYRLKLQRGRQRSQISPERQALGAHFAHSSHWQDLYCYAVLKKIK